MDAVRGETLTLDAPFQKSSTFLGLRLCSVSSLVSFLSVKAVSFCLTEEPGFSFFKHSSLLYDFFNPLKGKYARAGHLKFGFLSVNFDKVIR